MRGVCMLPKPTHTGGDPASRNAARAGGGVHSGSSGSVQYPVACIDGVQSNGRGTTGLARVVMATK